MQLKLDNLLVKMDHMSFCRSARALQKTLSELSTLPEYYEVLYSKKRMHCKEITIILHFKENKAYFSSEEDSYIGYFDFKLTNKLNDLYNYIYNKYDKKINEEHLTKIKKYISIDSIRNF